MKTLKTIALFCLLCFFTLSAFADEINTLVYQYYNPEVTVTFEEPLDVSAERQQQIADNISGVNSSNIVEINGESPDNIICTLFGHKLSTTTVTATHHKVHVHSPRCLMEVYDVTACSRCDYTDAELVGSFFVVCCPED